jgi:hypothetical protein
LLLSTFCITFRSTYPCLSFRLFLVFSTMPTHKHTSSVTQNRKAELTTAYYELGKELSSSKIRVVGNYTLGRVIGEGMVSLFAGERHSRPTN